MYNHHPNSFHPLNSEPHRAQSAAPENATLHWAQEHNVLTRYRSNSYPDHALCSSHFSSSSGGEEDESELISNAMTWGRDLDGGSAPGHTIEDRNAQTERIKREREMELEMEMELNFEKQIKKERELNQTLGGSEGNLNAPLQKLSISDSGVSLQPGRMLGNNISPHHMAGMPPTALMQDSHNPMGINNHASPGPSPSSNYISESMGSEERLLTKRGTGRTRRTLSAKRSGSGRKRADSDAAAYSHIHQIYNQNEQQQQQQQQQQQYGSYGASPSLSPSLSSSTPTTADAFAHQQTRLHQSGESLQLKEQASEQQQQQTMNREYQTKRELPGKEAEGGMHHGDGFRHGEEGVTPKEEKRRTESEGVRAPTGAACPEFGLNLQGLYPAELREDGVRFAVMYQVLIVKEAMAF